MWGWGLVGALTSIGAGIGRYFSRKNAAEEQIEQLNRQKNRNLQMMDLQYSVEKKNAEKKSKEANEQTTLREAMMNNNAKLALTQLGMGEEAQTVSYNKAQMQAGQSKGGMLDQMAGSGTKNSSAMKAVEMQDEMNDKSLQMQEDMDRKQNDLSLESAMNNFAAGGQELQQHRNAAKDLYDTYQAGGDQYNLFQKQKSNYVAGVQDNINNLKDATKFGVDDLLDITFGGLSGAANGLQFGSQTEDFYNDWMMKRKANKTPTFDSI